MEKIFRRVIFSSRSAVPLQNFKEKWTRCKTNRSPRFQAKFFNNVIWAPNNTCRKIPIEFFVGHNQIPTHASKIPALVATEDCPFLPYYS